MSRADRAALAVFLLALVLLLAVAAALLLSQIVHHPAPRHRRYRVPALGVAYTGTDYYFPTDYWNKCGNWTWLTAPCYRIKPRSGLSPQQQLRSDAAWMAHNRLGRFQRVWIVLDQGIRWSGSGAYQGLDAAYLANLDDALAILHAQNIRVDAVLFVYSKGSSDRNQFHAEALDGHHPQMRAGYLHALTDFAAHVAHNPVDAATLAVVDEMNEAYYQLERAGLSDSTIHAFLRDAYQALKRGAHALPVTASDTTRLLKDYRTWGPFYNDAVDVYDIHAYSDSPWNEAALWAKARTFTRAWFVGEAGCAPGHVSCTYSGSTTCTAPSSCALSVDGWWLAHLRADGAQAVLVEERNTAFGYPRGPTSQSATRVGQLIQQVTGSSGLRRRIPIRPRPPQAAQPCGMAVLPLVLALKMQQFAAKRPILDAGTLLSPCGTGEGLVVVR